jgi:hypothetical protein
LVPQLDDSIDVLFAQGPNRPGLAPRRWHPMLHPRSQELLELLGEVEFSVIIDELKLFDQLVGNVDGLPGQGAMVYPTFCRTPTKPRGSGQTPWLDTSSLTTAVARPGPRSGADLITPLFAVPIRRK